MCAVARHSRKGFDTAMTRIHHVFLDRDGTIIHDKHYLCDPEEVELLPGAVQALEKLVHHDCKLYLVSNQSGIGRGYFDETACRLCQNRLADLLREQGIGFVDMAFCPHAPEEGCDCRKPGLGLWRQLASLHDLRAEYCAMIGDKREDVAFGRNAGFAASIMVLTGHGQKHAASLHLPALPQDERYMELDWQNNDAWPHALAREFGAAVDCLLAL